MTGRFAGSPGTRRAGRGRRLALAAGLLTFCVLPGSACITLDPARLTSPHYDADAGRYRNLDNDDAIADKGFLDDAPPAPARLRPKDLLAPDGGVRIVWLGHSTVWIASNRNGRRFHLITDPVFAGILFTPRLIDFPIAPEDLPPIDAIAISHPHLDHFNFDSLRILQRLHPQARLYLPSGTRQIARDNGLRNLRILEWWQSEAIAYLEHVLRDQERLGQALLWVPGDVHDQE